MQTTHEDKSAKVAELRGLAEQVRTYQLEREWSDSRLAKEISHVGHSKTYKRILDAEDELDELSVENQLVNYRNAVELIKTRAERDLPAEPEYQDFRNIIAVRSAVAGAVNEESISRFVCIEGENGTGKDASMRSMVKTWPKLTVVVEAGELWRDSYATPLADIINCLGVRRREDGGEKFIMPHFPSQRQTVLLEELNKRRLVLAINEAQSMGIRGLNLMKEIINKTPTVLVFCCIPKLLNDLIRVGYEEAAQLFGNRLRLRVRLESPAADEIMLMFKRRGVLMASPRDESECAKRIEDLAPCYGNWAFVKRVTRKARVASGGNPIGLEKLVDQITRSKNECISQIRGKES